VHDTKWPWIEGISELQTNGAESSGKVPIHDARLLYEFLVPDCLALRPLACCDIPTMFVVTLGIKDSSAALGFSHTAASHDSVAVGFLPPDKRLKISGHTGL
jgi:hypothetical protein